MSIVATIDFEPFLSGDVSAKESTANSIIKSLQTTGFVVLTNHGVPQARVSAMMDWSKRFFAQPLEVKDLAPHPLSGAHHRGYSTIFREKIVQREREGLRSQKTLPSCKETFDCGAEDNAGMPNIWPPDGVLPGFKEACLEFYNICHKASLDILEAMACGMKLSPSHFTSAFTGSDNQIRLAHYPSIPRHDLEEEKVARIGAHSDFGGITLLFQDDVGGLEVEDPSSPGTFKPVIPIKGSMVVNAGDLMMRWTNDTIRSTVHRVVAPISSESNADITPPRYSIPYFCAPTYDTMIEPLPGTWDEKRSKKYGPIKAGDYFTQRLVEAY